MNISKALAEFVVRTNFEDIPSYVIENQKKSVMDAVGITYGASTLGDGCSQMVEIAEELAAGGRGERENLLSPLSAPLQRLPLSGGDPQAGGVRRGALFLRTPPRPHPQARH